jgi:hypothetical protein
MDFYDTGVKRPGDTVKERSYMDGLESFPNQPAG